MNTLGEARAALARANPREGERLALAAVAVARRDGDAETEARALSLACRAACDAGDASAAVRYGRAAVHRVDLGRTPADLRTIAFADLHGGYVLLGAASSAAHVYDRGQRAGDDAARWRMEADHGYGLLTGGDHMGAVRVLAAASDALASHDVVQVHHALALAADGRHGAALRVAGALGDGGADAWVLLCLARVWHAAGAVREAKTMADRAAHAARLVGRSDWRRAAAEIVRAVERRRH